MESRMLANQHVRFGERVTGDPHEGQPLPTRPQDLSAGMAAGGSDEYAEPDRDAALAKRIPNAQLR